MEGERSFNRHRRTLSYSGNRGATFSVFEADNKKASGPHPSEVYGFVGAISTVVATVIFMVWAYVPYPWLRSIGIFYYPSKYWALALPAYMMLPLQPYLYSTSASTLWQFHLPHLLTQYSMKTAESPCVVILMCWRKMINPLSLTLILASI